MDTKKRLKKIETELKTLHKKAYKKEQNDPFHNIEDFAKAWELFCAYMKPEWDAIAKLGREKRILMTPKFSNDEIKSREHVMSLKQFIENVENGEFIDYDGWGKYIRDGKKSNIIIKPSDVRYDSIRDDFDTIIWYNR